MDKTTKIAIIIGVALTSGVVLFFVIRKMKRKITTKKLEEESGVKNIDEKRIGIAKTPKAEAKRVEMVKKYPKLYQKSIFSK